MTEAETLLALAQCDTEYLRSAKELEAIPEAAEIVECRAKRKELKAKQDQVVELTDDVEAKVAKLTTEEERLIEKLKELQHTLDTTKDFRVTSSVTRDMEGLVKRQGNISKEQDALLERQIKIDHLANQVADMLHALDHKEEHLTAAFKEKGGKVKVRQDQLKAQHDELIAQLSAPLARKYEKLRAEKGGIGVAQYENGHCSVCRAELQTGHLAKLKEAGEVSECPNCHRIFVMRPQTEEAE